MQNILPQLTPVPSEEEQRRALKRTLVLHVGALPWPRPESRDRDKQKQPEDESQGGFWEIRKKHGTTIGCGGERGGCSEIRT